MRKISASRRKLKTVGFVGRTDADKGVDLELLIATDLAKMGMKILHLSSWPNTRAEELVRAGVEVCDNLKRHEYLGRLASLGCVVNTSPRESLFVSGIEATRLGIPVFAPRVIESGITDWNNPEFLYDPSDIQGAAGIISEASGISDISIPDVSRYSAANYVERVRNHIMGESDE
jgi:hypothetical protein